MCFWKGHDTCGLTLVSCSHAGHKTYTGSSLSTLCNKTQHLPVILSCVSTQQSYPSRDMLLDDVSSASTFLGPSPSGGHQL